MKKKKTLVTVLLMLFVLLLFPIAAPAQTPATGVTLPPPPYCSEYDCTVTLLFNEGGYMVADTVGGYMWYLFKASVCAYYLWC